MEMLRVIFSTAKPITKCVRQLCISSTSVISSYANRKECGTSYIHTSGRRFDLNEFFDLDNFDADEIKVGRPWRKSELRIKSNTDLHKLWYVLLKERNLLMTMEHMYRKQMEPLPSPERFEKVEESMENLLDVVRERNVAYHLLEKGKLDEPKTYVTRNAVGIPYQRTETEHYIPKELNERFKLMHPKKERWMDQYLALYEEKYRRQRNYKIRMHEKKRKDIMEEFEMEEDEIPEMPDLTGDKLEEYLENTSELKDINHKGR